MFRLINSLLIRTCLHRCFGDKLFVNQDIANDVSVNYLYVNQDMSAQDVSVNDYLLIWT